MIEPLRRAILVAWRSKRIWWLQVLLNPVFMALAVAGLIIPEAQIWQLLLTVVLGLAILLGALWLQAATLVYFADYHVGEDRPADAFRSVRHTLLPFAAWAAVLSACLLLLNMLSAHELQFASYLRSILPVGARKILTEVRLDNFLAFVSWCLFWIVLPGFFVPLGLQLAKHGVHGLSSDGWHAWSRIVRRFSYWIIFLLAALFCVWIPELLIHWRPAMSRLSGEIASLGGRLLVAWLLCATAWVILTSVVGWFNAEGALGISPAIDDPATGEA